MNPLNYTSLLNKSPWTEGFQDRLAGYGVDECPYTWGTKLCLEWIEGWLDADANGAYL